MPQRSVNIQVAPDLVSKPDVRFDKGNFDAFVWKHGYPVYHDKMIQCPCGGTGHPNVTCGNCLGTGWVLVERVQTRMVLQSINLDTKFKEWSVEKTGTVKITALDKDVLNFMDRVVALQAVAPFSELLKIRTRILETPNKFAYSSYDIIGIIGVYRWTSDSAALTRMVEGTDFTYERNKIIFSDIYDNNSDLRVTIKYWHNPQFHIIDVMRDIINQDTWGNDPKVKTTLNQRLPIHATGRRSHYVLDAENYNGNLVIDNSTDEYEPGIPKITPPANLPFNMISNPAYPSIDELRKRIEDYHIQLVELSVPGNYVLQDIIKISPYIYLGYLEVDTGEWYIKRVDEV